MVEPNNIKDRKNEIKDFVAAADVAQAVKRLIDFVRDFCLEMEDEAILLSMKFYDLDKELRMDIILPENAKVERNKIVLSLLRTLNVAMTKTKHQ